MLYYDIDHKVGVVGVLYPQAVNLCFLPGLCCEELRSNKQMFVLFFKIRRCSLSFATQCFGNCFVLCFFVRWSVPLLLFEVCGRFVHRASLQGSGGYVQFCSCSLLCALSFSALCTSYFGPRLNLYIHTALQFMEIYERGTVWKK